MSTILLVIHIFLALSLVGIILLQKTDSASGLTGGNSSMLSVRGKANFFTRVTSILAALFMANCLLLAILSSSHLSKSVVDVDTDKKPVLNQDTPPSIDGNSQTNENKTPPLPVK